MADAELVASQTEGGGAVSSSVVGHDALNADAAAAIVLDGGTEEAAGGIAELVGATSAKAIREASSIAT